MKQLPDKCVDAVITDPPYNVGINYGKLTDDLRVDFSIWMRERFDQLRRIARTTLITTGQINLAMYAAFEPWKWLLCWRKPAAMGRSPVGFCNWEPIAMWGRGGKASVDIFEAPIIPDRSLNWHPCPKPLMWAERQIECVDAETILDPFLGSGTTAVAAKKLGRHFLGFEISPEYCRIAEERIARVEAQPNLFAPRAEQSALAL